MERRPHTLGIDDGPFDKFADRDVPIVGVMMEGADLVESVAITRFPVDGDHVTGFLADWIEGLRMRPALQAVLLGGVTIAGLAVVDVPELARRLGRPVLALNRRVPANERLAGALRAAGLAERIEILERCPAPHRVEDGLYVAAAGLDPEEAVRRVAALRRKSAIPEPLRLAHLIGRAIARGESRGRV